MSQADDLFKLWSGMADRDPEIREQYIRAPFGWAGGKEKSKDKILEILPYRNTYVEHCGGSGVIFLNRRPSNLDVFNDRDAGVTAFYRCLKDREKMRKMMEWLSLTVHSREEFIWCKKTWKDCTDDVERAARWYYIVRMSFGQQKRNFGRAIRGKSQQPLMIYSSFPLFPQIHARMSEAQIENLDLFDSIKDYDSEDTVHYIDPNYHGVSPGIYENEIDEASHHRLCETIMNGKGFFALSGYPNHVYDSPEFHWDRRITWDVNVTLQAQAFTEGNNKAGRENDSSLKRVKATECLWIKDCAP